MARSKGPMQTIPARLNAACGGKFKKHSPCWGDQWAVYGKSIKGRKRDKLARSMSLSASNRWSYDAGRRQLVSTYGYANRSLHLERYPVVGTQYASQEHSYTLMSSLVTSPVWSSTHTCDSSAVIRSPSYEPIVPSQPTYLQQHVFGATQHYHAQDGQMNPYHSERGSSCGRPSSQPTAFIPHRTSYVPSISTTMDIGLTHRSSQSCGTLHAYAAPLSSSQSPAVLDRYVVQENRFPECATEDWDLLLGSFYPMQSSAPEIAHVMSDFSSLIADLEEYVRQSSSHT